jgi:hypothetical protein
MFIGHFGVGFGAKRIAPAVSLGTLLLAALWADLLWAILVLLGIERVAVAPGATAMIPLDFQYNPYSHSLVALLLWGLLLGAVYWLLRRRLGLAAPAVIAGLVLSHWVLDALTHRPDMPLDLAGARLVGLGLWNSVPGTLAVEVPFFLLGVALYARATAPRDRIGTYAFWALVGLLLALYLGGLFGPPPPSADAVAWTDLALLLFIAWGYWVDRHRAARV